MRRSRLVSRPRSEREGRCGRSLVIFLVSGQCFPGLHRDHDEIRTNSTCLLNSHVIVIASSVLENGFALLAASWPSSCTPRSLPLARAVLARALATDGGVGRRCGSKSPVLDHSSKRCGAGICLPPHPSRQLIDDGMVITLFDSSMWVRASVVFTVHHSLAAHSISQRTCWPHASGSQVNCADQW